jgi:Fe-S-cluster-containing dehydrogenase component/DMSO reductase anchor subunit
MRKGFVFNHNKCVSCNSCSAACILENGWKVCPRNVFTYNSSAEYLLSLIHLSLACNHCESAICMEGCPASAYSREDSTGAIILDETKCIGCRYCQWNCPYDAPKFDAESKTIAKCNLCYTGLIEGRQPACSSACPTGALSFGPLIKQNPENIYSWFPDKKLNPSLSFTGTINNEPLRIIPENKFEQNYQKPAIEEKNISSELSLIIFSFLATLSVATIITSLIKGVYPDKMIFSPVLILAVLASFFHLGRKLRSWRSIFNIKRSPLSREIVFLIIYFVVSSSAVYFQVPVLLISSSITGLILLLLIDSVYIYAGRSKTVFLHSGQTFISALIIVSFFSGMVLPFIFMALIKLLFSIYRSANKNQSSIRWVMRFLRLAFLIVPGISLISHISYGDIFIPSLFLTGELLDRILFYFDFNPLNIKRLIFEQFNMERDEKERG